jgi:hypothetical protein
LFVEPVLQSITEISPILTFAPFFAISSVVVAVVTDPLARIMDVAFAEAISTCGLIKEVMSILR